MISDRKGGGRQTMIMQGKILEGHLGPIPLEPPLWQSDLREKANP